ncbi:hypothetical protein [Maritalea sp.]|uniref:hypothetical protein n=1 Tax=Maritalea sp. TaxID=2003361 RepID=UPI003EF2BD6F
MTLKIESAAGFQGGAFEAGNASLRSEQYSRTDAVAAKAVAGNQKLAPTSPQKVTSVSEKSIDQFPKLVGPEAPASLLFEASLVASAKIKENQQANENDQPTAAIFPRMINRRWVPSPSTMRMLEELK